MCWPMVTGGGAGPGTLSAAGHSPGPRISLCPPSMGRTSGVTWLLTNIPRRAATIPTTAPVWPLLQCHHWKAIPSPRKASIRACVAADSFLTHVTIVFHALLTHALLLGAAVAGIASPGAVSVGTIYLHMRDLAAHSG